MTLSLEVQPRTVSPSRKAAFFFAWLAYVTFLGLLFTAPVWSCPFWAP